MDQWWPSDVPAAEGDHVFKNPDSKIIARLKSLPFFKRLILTLK
ncbi:Uncharacterized protein AC502_1172 [Pseudomonas syringae pv. maculicola]|uniref:Uncharacterized protein n=1 Tax=Pseudomonas syringae pv. tomato (strain ATCC BAA-871 / DC3000) TaxID=223283 RepID=Q883D3_PSESM|nr:hypothetical protein PSPTO_2433 [Pseudomonas syringae pv. tomato str. DC3000]KPB93972.1 Uncharacterized protein AC502_1172 [Pseudomonas syringae pv. maculicola]MCF5225629.1 hypothetical protein [Pseudomonas syringae]MCF5244379.1 hypothetical protein [Pseudomonas syringae]RMR29546.1 hypothetical protein ALP87_05441 [Pseudomonas syringae pv. coriandricola]